MKKLLGVALALTMGATCTAALAGCDSCGGVSEDDKATLAKAMTSIRTLVINKYDKKETSKDYEIYGSVKVDGEDYAVSWELSSTDSNIANYIKLGEMNATTKIINVSVTRPETAVEYTMKATIKVGGASDSASFTATIPAGMKAGDGTEANPYTVSQAFALASAMDPKAKLEESDNPTRVCVTGYIVDCGNNNNASRASFVKIAESASAEKADWFTILSINYGSVLTSFDDLKIGAKITVSGFLMNYQKDASSAAQAELTYFGSEGITCVYIEKVEKTDAEKAQAALDALDIPANVTSNITLNSSVYGVELSITNSTNTTAIALDGTVTRPEEDKEVTITVTASIDGATKTKDFTVTVKAPAAVGASATFDFSNVAKGNELDSATAKALFVTVGGEGAGLTDVAVTKVFQGNGTGGGSYETKGGLIKFGTSSLDGELTLTFSKNVSKVVINCVGWKDTDKLSVNGSAAQALPKYDGAAKDYEFELATPSNTVKIATTQRAIVFSITVYFAD